MTPVQDIPSLANGVTGQAELRPSSVPANNNSPRNRVYLVRGFVAYLCNEAQGTMTRYAGTVIVANLVAHDTPGEFGGAAAEIVARGLTGCIFGEQRFANRPQVVSVSLTTTLGNESVTLRHAATLENQP
jgi:hypothetical protein